MLQDCTIAQVQRADPGSWIAPPVAEPYPHPPRLAGCRGAGGRWQGHLDFDAALRWEATDQTLRLSQVRVCDFSRMAGGAAPRTGAERLAAASDEIRFVPNAR